MNTLSREVLVGVLSVLGNPQDIGKAAMTSQQFAQAAAEPALWKELAEHRYGSHVVKGSLHLYQGNYRRMVLDDNRQGALPTLSGTWASAWRHNSQHTFYCCLVTGVKWHRVSNRVWIYLDARGEADLRHPNKSGIWLRNPSTGTAQVLEQRVLPPRPNPDGSYYLRDIEMNSLMNVREYDFVSLPGVTSRGHFQGALLVDAGLFRLPGAYEFCYANATPHVGRDYDSCTLFTIEPGQSLKDVFPAFSLEQETPFALETPTMRQERWRPYLPSNRGGNIDSAGHRNLWGPWPECVGMTGEECKAYILSQNPDLRVTIYQPGNGMIMYQNLIVSEVRFWVDRNGIVRDAPERG
jgi:hypothetical protein